MSTLDSIGLDYDQTDCLPAALAYADRGWPVVWIKPQSKEPLTKNGVNDGTCDPAQIRRWASRWPNANVGIACGAPGPQVLDIDDLEAGHDALAIVSRLCGPDVATSRGRQFYLQGSSRGTVVLAYGELRGAGSYVVAPPSVHPSGKLYCWVVEPTRAALPPIPDGLVPDTTGTVGAGEQPMHQGLVPHGQRYPYLRDFTIRLVRAGVTDERRLLAHVRLEFELACEPYPPPVRGSFETLARFGSRCRIADRERVYTELVEDTFGDEDRITVLGRWEAMHG